MTFTTEDLKLIYRAVRYYQMHKTSLNGKEYQHADEILSQMFNQVNEFESK